MPSTTLADRDLTRLPSRRDWLLDLGILGLATILLRLPAFLAAPHLTFDDGVFGASAVAMREGGTPFQEVFSSQGPLFLPLVRAFDLIGLQTLDAPRLLGLASGLVLVATVYVIGREVGDRTGALLAAGLTTTAGSVLWVTGPVAADGPALALAAVALWLALRIRDGDTRLSVAVVLGLATGAALSTKLMAAPVLVPIVTILVRPVLEGLRRGSNDVRAWTVVLVSGATAGLVWLAPSGVFGIADVWDQSVTYHTEAATGRDPLANLGKILSTLADRDLALLVFAATAASFAIISRRSRPDRPAAPTRDAGRTPGDGTVLGAWLLATLVLLLIVEPLWRPHISGLIAPAALLVGRHRPPIRVVVIVALLLVPLQAFRVRDYLAPGDYHPRTQALLQELEALPDEARVISDDPGHVWRSGRRTPDDLVDTSILRIESGRITTTSLARAAADDRVCAVVVWSSVRFGSLSGLESELEREDYALTRRFDDDRVLFTRPDCDPGGRAAR